MEREMLSKTLDLCSELTRFVARGDFIFTYSGTFSFYIRGLNVVVEWLTLPLSIWEMKDSNLGPKTDYPE
jgi:hypothetical protein